MGYIALLLFAAAGNLIGWGTHRHRFPLKRFLLALALGVCLQFLFLQLAPDWQRFTTWGSQGSIILAGCYRSGFVLLPSLFLSFPSWQPRAAFLALAVAFLLSVGVFSFPFDVAVVILNGQEIRSPLSNEYLRAAILGTIPFVLGVAFGRAASQWRRLEQRQPRA